SNLPSPEPKFTSPNLLFFKDIFLQVALIPCQKMTLVSAQRSTLNPNAPLFVPAAVRQVEDFSPEWWELVTTSTWFHDYWLSQQQGEGGFFGNTEDEIDFTDIADLLPDSIDADEDTLTMESQYEQFLLFSEMERRNAKAYDSN
ncbi:hypothetical protein FTX61_26640, partial [Nitriliruptoraceae bacterium ZYF776]|nr:hypothetical protein [Profundirhabdus halotolerans]